MFLGEFEHTMDVKGRVSLPKDFRNALAGKLIITKGLENCLYIYPQEQYKESLGAYLRGGGPGGDFDPSFRKVRRFFASGAVETELDSAGRVRLTSVLRDHAGLEKEVTIIGNDERIELWDSAAWAAYQDDVTSNIEESAAELVDKGLL
jgi:MraZ protein